MVTIVIELLIVVPIVAMLTMLLLGSAHTISEMWIVGGLAFCCAVVIGLPALRWAIERGRTRILSLVLIGVVAGAVPPLLMLLSGSVGLVARGGTDYLRWVLTHGASIPWYGIRRWSQFLVETGTCAAIGGVSGAILSVTQAVPRLRSSGLD